MLLHYSDHGTALSWVKPVVHYSGPLCWTITDKFVAGHEAVETPRGRGPCSVSRSLSRATDWERSCAISR